MNQDAKYISCCGSLLASIYELSKQLVIYADISAKPHGKIDCTASNPEGVFAFNPNTNCVGPFWLVRAHVTQAAALSAPVENEVI
jgi:hypothetical protein